MSFSDDIKKGIKNIEADQKKIIKLSAIELFRRIVLSSPVGNPSLWLAKNSDGSYTNYLDSNSADGYTGGSFRNNWFLSFRVPSDRAGRPANDSGSGSTRQLRRIATTDSDSYILTNNLPYAERIEKGWSTQAPNGVLRKNSKKWRTIVSQTSRKVLR